MGGFVLWSLELEEGISEICSMWFLPPETHGLINDDAKHAYQWLSELPRWLSGKDCTCQAGNTGSILGQEDRLEKGMKTHFSILA